MTTAIEQARELSANSKAAAQERFDALARDPDNKQDLAPEAVLEILESAGKTFDDLLEAHTLADKRIGWAAAIEAAAAADSRRADIERELEAERARFAPLLAAHRAKLQSLQSQLPPEALIWEATSARNKLLATAPAQLTRREQELAAERSRLMHQADSLSEQLRTAGRGERRELEAATAENERVKSAATKDRLTRARAAVARATEAAKLPAQELATLHARLAKIETEVGQLHKAKLLP